MIRYDISYGHFYTVIRLEIGNFSTADVHIVCSTITCIVHFVNDCANYIY